MRDLDPLKWWLPLTLIVVSQDATPLPDELILNCLAQCFLDRRNEEKIAGLMHGCIHRIPVAAVISLIESLRGLPNPNRTPMLVGLNVHAGLVWESSPSLRQL